MEMGELRNGKDYLYRKLVACGYHWGKFTNLRGLVKPGVRVLQVGKLAYRKLQAVSLKQVIFKKDAVYCYG